jgi:hypothetical protein
MLDPKFVTPRDDEIDYMAPRGLWDDFLQYWTPVRKAPYLGQLRDQGGMKLSERAKALGIEEAELRRELAGVWGVLMWDQSQDDPVPIHRD